MTTGEKGMFMNSNTSAKPISKVSKTDMSAEEININPQPDKNKDEEEEKYDDDFDGQDDYEFWIIKFSFFAKQVGRRFKNLDKSFK